MHILSGHLTTISAEPMVLLASYLFFINGLKSVVGVCEEATPLCKGMRVEKGYRASGSISTIYLRILIRSIL